MVVSLAELEEKHTTRNLELVRQLLDVGIDTSAQHDVSHALFGDSQKIENTLEGLAGSGFSAKQTESDTITVTTNVSLETTELSSQCAQIERTAKEFGFSYSGWTITAEAPERNDGVTLDKITKGGSFLDLPDFLAFFLNIFRR